MTIQFTLNHTDKHCAARRGRIETAHGSIETPVFMPVATQAAAKGVTRDQLLECGAQIILGNTYHLHLRPGDELIAKLGGLHQFTAWPRPMLTDSGGFQVFSLAKLNKVTDDGVEFQSHIDGNRLFIGPREAIRIQENLGADIIMAFDECPPHPIEEKYARESMERTIRWAHLCQQSQTREDLSLFPIGQGSFFPKLRVECMERLLELDAPGYAIGGVSVGEQQELGREAVAVSVPIMPTDKPRYVMGIGKPEDLLDYIEIGVDMFDCVMPTRNGRNSSAFTREGPMTIRNQKFRDDSQPLDSDCKCTVCQSFSRAYLRHLYLAKEMNAVIYLAYHNVYFYLDLMRQARAAIEQDTFTSFKKAWLTRYQSHAE